jgi:oligopeptide transport system permease protein
MTDAAIPASAPLKGRSLWDDARRRMARNPAAMASLAVLVVMTLLAILGPSLWEAISGHSVEAIYRDRVGIAPTMQQLHLLGTDSEGRDMLARTLFGLGVSLQVGVVATLVALVIGVLWGAIAGYLGGAVDQVMMRIVDVLYAVPFIFFVILLMVVFGRDLILIFVAIGAVEWLTMARIVRGQTIALRNKEFIEAARAGGVGPAAIVERHIVPNVLGPVVVYATINVARVILLESFLSFLGLGVQEPLTSLGALISAGARQMETAPWMLLAPAIVMFVTLLCLNFLGDGLRDALDPKDR